MMKRKLAVGIASFATVIALAACNGGEDEEPKEETQTNEHGDMNHEDMDHAGSPEVPDGLQHAEDPKYEVGSKAIITEGHMEGMKGAEATIVGAYDTNAYTVTFTPADGGEKVTSHKWVIQEEIEDAGEKLLEPGTKVTMDADHMKGMEGAEAVIEHGEKTTVYMVDFTADGEEVNNHKWVTESELTSDK